MTDSIRIAAIIEYDGHPYQGLQVQKTGKSIQSEIELAARTLGIENPEFKASGRTDSGVHARGQVITLALPASLEGKEIRKALNWHLPPSIRVRKVVQCSEKFDPRRDARLRTYRYLLCANQPFPPLMKNRMGAVKRRLDVELMQQAADTLKGFHDFQAWRSTLCQAKRTELEITHFEVQRWNDGAPHGEDNGCFDITVSCRSFLHRMVRFLVGGLERVGSGACSVEELKRHLENKTLPDRVVPAPACGLSLEHVYYPPELDPFLEGN